MASQSLKVTKTRKLSGINCPCCGQNITFSSLSGSLDVHVAEMNPKTRAAVRDINKMKQLHKKIARRRLKAFYRRGKKIRVSAPVASTSSKQYQYQPLENNGTIRILILHPGKQSDQLVGTIEVVPIQSAVPYETMSYVWADSGPPKHAGTMVIRGRGNEDALLALRGGSIVAALHQLRRPDRPRRIWTDQCCINQDDLEERSKQVQFMDQIYRNSTHVLVWLGSDTENEAASAFDTVRKLDKILEEPPADGRGSDRQKTDLASYIIANQKSLQALTKCTWFTRGWIVQEIGTKAPATLHWGNAKLDWDTLASVCERLKGYHHLRSVLGISTSDISFLYRRFIEPDEKTHHVNRFNFVYELQRSRHLRFSDDRDRVFAFLGHFSLQSHHPLGCQPLSIAADYTKTVRETYIDVAVEILRQRPNSTCILLASVQHGDSVIPLNQARTDDNTQLLLTNEGKLPSWVPDWRQSQGIILAEPICSHRAHADSIAKVEILQRPDVMLRICGMEMDTIEACSRRLVEDDLYSGKTPVGVPTMIEKLWNDICQKTSFNLRDTYRNGQTALFAFMQTLTNGCVQAAGHKSVPYHEIPEKVWLRKAIRHIVDTLGTSHSNVSKDVLSAAGDLGPEADSDNWSRWATSASDGRIFARTRTGYYVLGPAAIQAGDVVCVLLGCKVPFCLRPVGSRYQLVGECYVHGLMKGEAMEKLKQNELREASFDII
ncbi:hypothetical protein LMH87_000080 [Akanthomyces muscarius]|uniref:Heterokaryon incompatibility domain-containing protein n=1 Tax=Akanthomyces muscarius TaxID=2231603 RepID=A0A9W8UN93_AKAMU|nr:hypothetical protein LMH87_000080 [Akanthomyces muscarius]KAJ4154804.1 hypothetical protein LMH87_000080 [Akanthomyces muscarius]